METSTGLETRAGCIQMSKVLKEASEKMLRLADDTNDPDIGTRFASVWTDTTLAWHGLKDTIREHNEAMGYIRGKKQHLQQWQADFFVQDIDDDGTESVGEPDA